MLRELNFILLGIAEDNMVQCLIFPVWKSLPLQIQEK